MARWKVILPGETAPAFEVEAPGHLDAVAAGSAELSRRGHPRGLAFHFVVERAADPVVQLAKPPPPERVDPFTNAFRRWRG